MDPNFPDRQFQSNQQRLYDFKSINNLNKLKELKSNCMMASSTTINSVNSPCSDKQNTQLRISLMELNEENSRLLEQIYQIKHDSNEQIRSLNKKIETLNTTIGDLSSIIIMKESEIEQTKHYYQSQLSTSDSEIKQLKQQQKSLKEEIVRLRKLVSQIQDFKDKENYQKMKHESLTSELQKLHEQNFKLFRENQQLKEINSALQEKLKNEKSTNFIPKLNLKNLDKANQKSQTESNYKTHRQQRTQLTNYSPSSGLRSESKFQRRILGCQLNSIGNQNSLNSHRLINMEQDIYENSGERLFNKQNIDMNQDHSAVYTINGQGKRQGYSRNNTIKQCLGQSNANVNQTFNPSKSTVVSPFKSVFDQLGFDDNQAQIIKDLPAAASFLKNKQDQKPKQKQPEPSRDLNPFLDPYYAFFTLTVQSTKLNSPIFDHIVNFDLQKQWSYVQKNVNFNLWPSYLQKKLRAFQKTLIEEAQLQKKHSRRKLTKA